MYDGALQGLDLWKAQVKMKALEVIHHSALDSHDPKLGSFVVVPDHPLPPTFCGCRCQLQRHDDTVQ